MAELAPGSKQLSLHRPEEIGLARARIWWALKPLGFLGLLLWVLHPHTADRADYGTMLLLGFLLGALYGLIIYGARLRSYMVLKPVSGRLQSNRIPTEYYWGEVAQVLYDNTQRSE